MTALAEAFVADEKPADTNKEPVKPRAAAGFLLSDVPCGTGVAFVMLTIVSSVGHGVPLPARSPVTSPVGVVVEIRSVPEVLG